MAAKKARRTPDWPWGITEESRPIPVADIIRNEALQVRARLLPELSKKYAHEMQAGHKFPPVTLGMVNDRLYLLDG